MIKDDQKFFDKAMIAAMAAIVAKTKSKKYYPDDQHWGSVADGAVRYAEELLRARNEVNDD